MPEPAPVQTAPPPEPPPPEQGRRCLVLGGHPEQDIGHTQIAECPDRRVEQTRPRPTAAALRHNVQVMDPPYRAGQRHRARRLDAGEDVPDQHPGKVGHQHHRVPPAEVLAKHVRIGVGY